MEVDYIIKGEINNPLLFKFEEEAIKLCYCNCFGAKQEISYKVEPV